MFFYKKNLQRNKNSLKYASSSLGATKTQRRKAVKVALLIYLLRKNFKK